MNQGSSGSDSRMPLSGLVVLDLTLARAGPACVRHLADWGADVIRIQRPEDDRDEVIGKRAGADYQNLHRNKRVIALNLKTPRGYEAFLRLVRKADVVIENMRVSVKHRLKIAWEDLRAINPRLVYGSISGFGQTGPYAERAGVDQIAQGMGGLMSVTGLPGQGPVRVGIAVVDMTAGNLLALAIMMALYERERTGVGKWVYTSLMESVIFMLDFQAARYLAKGEVPQQAGNAHPTVVPTGVFPTRDGHISIGASSAKQWKNLCETLGQPQWLDNPAWSTQLARSRDRQNVHDAISSVTRTRPSRHWAEKFDAVGIPCGPIYRVDEVFADPQVVHLGMAIPVDHPRLGPTHFVNSPLNMEGVTKSIYRTAPIDGADTREVLAAVGYTDADLEVMHAEGTI
jgi:formyl-CoA transferase